jgi:predicted dehydrogenase
MNILRAGILGCGGFAHRHAQIIAALPDELELAAFSDRTSAKAQTFSDQYTGGRAAVFTDHHIMLDKANLDLLVICLPPYGHTDEVEVAAQYGVHLLMEKPIALTSEHAWRMVEAAEQTQIKTQVGFMFRFGEAVERLKSLIESGEAGPVGLMSARYFCNALHADWWRDKSRSGGQVVEQIIHMFDLMRFLMVDLMRFLMGDPVTIYSRQENVFHRERPDYTVEDVSATVVAFRSSGIGVVYATNGAIPGKWINDYRIVARNLTAEFSNANQATITFTNTPDLRQEVITSEKDFRRDQLLDLLHAIRTNGSTRTPLREGAKSLDLVLAAAKSAESHAEVRV